jgi:hypothetical protein
VLFGRDVEPNFDLAKEQRRNRLGYVFLLGTVLCLLYLFDGRPFAVEVFQVFIATVLCYGASFYVDRRYDLGKPWLWKAFLASIPMHLVYLAALIWSDKTFPTVMTKSILFIPTLAIAFGIESIIVDRIVDHFKPPSASSHEQ